MTKFDCDSVDAFMSPNMAPLAKIGINIEISWHRVLRENSFQKTIFHDKMDPRVAILQLFPGIRASTVHSFLTKDMRGVVLLTYGSGNAPDARKDIIKLFKDAHDHGIVIVNVTQCTKGTVTTAYSSGNAFSQIGVISGKDMV